MSITMNIKNIKQMHGSLFLLISFIFFIACSSSDCRHTRRRPSVDPSSSIFMGEDLKIATPYDSNVPTAFVYKYDGSLQCGMGKAIPLDVMALELKGLQIFSKENRLDGTLHIQQCGTMTGQINIYEIPKSEVGQVLQKGFKLLSLDP